MPNTALDKLVESIHVFILISLYCYSSCQLIDREVVPEGEVGMSFNDTSQHYLENGYALGRGYASSLRLNLQHKLFRELLGYSIHPTISPNLPPNAKIADVGARTGQWLLDVHDQLPSAQLDGFDISSDQFPNKAWLPTNITLQELDIMEAVPPSLENRYDLIHVQLFLCVVPRDGPMTVLKELYEMLSRLPRKTSSTHIHTLSSLLTMPIP